MSQEFEEMLLTQLPKLRGFALSLTRVSSDADDLVQTAVERILKYQAQFEVGSNFSAWSYRILKNSYISDCRSNKRRPDSLTQHTESAVLPTSLVSSARQEDHVYTREVVNAMDKLSPRLREILTLICGAQLPYEEVADMLACSVGTVKSRLFRAREQMKSLLLDIAPGAIIAPEAQAAMTAPPLAHAGA